MPLMVSPRVRLCDVVSACVRLCSCADINKFLWMVRIGGSTEKGRHIKEADYFTPQGEFRVDRDGSPVLLNCLMYKMCYYRFGQVYTEQGTHSHPCTRTHTHTHTHTCTHNSGKPSGYDRVRNAEIGNKVGVCLLVVCDSVSV